MRVDPGSFDRAAMEAVETGLEVDTTSKRMAEAIRREAARLAPKRTGNLARNIVVEKVNNGRTVEYHVGWNHRAFYGPYVEFGTADTPARPHLRPASDRYTNRRR